MNGYLDRLLHPGFTAKFNIKVIDLKDIPNEAASDEQLKQYVRSCPASVVILM